MHNIAINVTTVSPGTLEKNISSNKKYLIQELSVLGYYCSELDSPFIKELCNANENSATVGKLEVLDLSQAEIRQARNYNYFSLRDDDLVNCKTLKKVIFSKLISLNPKCFSGCTSLEAIEYSDDKTYKSIDGILYQTGIWTVLYKTYCNYEFGKWILVKYPSAKEDSDKILFDRINQIADYAFEDSKITDLYMSTIPPACTELAFLNVDISKITLHVPIGSYHSYWSHPVWGEFRIVEE